MKLTIPALFVFLLPVTLTLGRAIDRPKVALCQAWAEPRPDQS